MARDATIVLIGLGQERRSLQIMHPRTPDHLRLVEQNCMSAGVNLRVVPIPHGNGTEQAARAATRLLDEAEAGGAVIGHILWAPLMSPAFLAAIAGHLQRSMMPLSIFYEWLYGTPYDPGRNPRHHVAQFAIGWHEEAASEVGTYLFARDHRHIAYLSPFHQSQWSRGRLATLEALASAAGAHVHVFTIDRFKDAYDHYLADEAAGRYRDFRDAYYGLASADALGRGELGRAWGDSLLHMLMRRSVAANLEPLVLAMLDRKEITACVAANDQTALIVMDIAASRGVRVPRDLAVVGFDNSFECVNRDLTSYDFNLAAAARATVNHVLMPGAALRTGEQLIRINGILVRRGST
jgi:DNA-binding LacI/PurR family transcriptional regulator